MNWYWSPLRLTAIQCLGLILKILWSMVSSRKRLIRKPTSSMPSLRGAMAKGVLRSCQREEQHSTSRASMSTFTSQSPPKMCLWGLMMAEGARVEQSEFMRYLVKTCPPRMLLRLCRPHCRERAFCFSKQSSYCIARIPINKTAPRHQPSQIIKTTYRQAPKTTPKLFPSRPILIMPCWLFFKKQWHHEIMVFFLLSFCHSSRGMISTEALSKDQERGTSVESSVFWPLRLRLFSAPFLHMRMMRLTSGQPLRQGSLMMREKQFSRPTLRFSMSSGLLLVFCQKWVLGKGGSCVPRSNFSRVSWTAFSSLKRYRHWQFSLLVRSLRCSSQRTTPSSMTQVGMRSRQNLSDRLKSQSPSTSFFHPCIAIKYKGRVITEGLKRPLCSAGGLLKGSLRG